MKLRFGIALTLGFGLMAHPGWAQSNAEQMQKAIYEQETAGNPDAAIKIYQQVLSSGPNRQDGARAQLGLAQAYLQKGSLQDAAREFQVLAQSYPEAKDLIASMATKAHPPTFTLQVDGKNVTFMPVAVTPSVQRGSFENGHFKSFLTNVDLAVPDGYKFGGCGESSDNGDMAFLNSSVNPEVKVWMRPEVQPASKLESLLRTEPVKKASMRDAGWKIRQESIQQHTVQSHPGLSAIADFETGDKHMVEYFIWVQTGKTKLQFFGEAPPDQLSALQDSVDRVASLASIP